MSEIIVRVADITDLEVDAIVNAANNHLWMGSGVAGAIRRKGGVLIEKEAVEKGPIPVGSSTLTEAGKLKAKKVIHAAIMAKDMVTDGTKIEEATRSALDCAREADIRSIAFPAFGTGAGGFPVDKCAEIMVGVVRDYIGRHPDSFDRIYFSLLDEQAAAAFRNALNGQGD